MIALYGRYRNITPCLLLPLPKRRPLNPGPKLAPVRAMLAFLKSISAKNPNGGRGPEKPAVSVRERVSALSHLPAFLKLIWHTSPALALANIALRLIRAFLPLATLYVGKLIIDAVVQLTRLPAPERVLTPVLTLVALEFGLVLLADGLGRGVALLDSLLGIHRTRFIVLFPLS